MQYTPANATEIDLGYGPAPDYEYTDAYGLFWDAVNPLPVGAVVGVGFRGEPDRNIVWFRKDSRKDFQFTVVQNEHEHEGVREDLPVGYVENMDPNTLSMGGDLEVAYIAKEA